MGFNHNYSKEHREFTGLKSYIYFLNHTIKFYCKITTFCCVLDDGPKKQQKDANFLLNVTRLFPKDISFLKNSACFMSLMRAKTQNMQQRPVKPHDTVTFSSYPALLIFQWIFHFTATFASHYSRKSFLKHKALLHFTFERPSDFSGDF